MTTNPHKRQDSLNEIVLLKDTRAASFNEKQTKKGTVATILGTKQAGSKGSGNNRSKVIQLCSKQISYYSDRAIEEEQLSVNLG